jgi:riboflavin synthase
VFTGLVEEIGTVTGFEPGSEGARIEVEAALASELEAGDSIAVNGACLTASSVGRRSFGAEVINQTLGLTTLGDLAPGVRVHLEPAMRASDRFGGHIVQGHVDGVAEVIETGDEGISRRIRLSLDDRLARFVIPQGSVALDGVSLTVAALGDGWLEVALIPETLERTTLGELKVSSRVNLECDLLAKHLERLVSPLIAEKGE